MARESCGQTRFTASVCGQYASFTASESDGALPAFEGTRSFLTRRGWPWRAGRRWPDPSPCVRVKLVILCLSLLLLLHSLAVSPPGTVVPYYPLNGGGRIRNHLTHWFLTLTVEVASQVYAHGLGFFAEAIVLEGA